MTDHDIFIDEDGTLQTIYSDDVAGLFSGDEQATRRASHVEPVPGGGWAADLAPIGGPVLGPFRTRQAALDAEVAWIVARMAERKLEVK